MDPLRFDALARAAAHLSRRAFVMLSAAGAVLTTAPESTARRGVHSEHNLRGDNAIMCVAGETRRVAKKHRQRYLKQGATRGECVASGCPAGHVSCNGGCIAESACCTNADCTIAQTCVSGVCTPIPCTQSLDRVSPAACVGGVCVCC